MKNSRFLFLLLTQFLFFSFTSVAKATDNDLIEKFTKQAIAEYKNGQIDIALEYYARALTINPHDNFLIDKVYELSSNPYLSSDNKLKILQLRNLYEQISNLSTKINYYGISFNALKLKLISSGVDRTSLDNNLSKIEDNLKSSIKSFAEKSSSKSQLDIINNGLIYETEKLSNELLISKYKYEFLLSINENINDNVNPNKSLITLKQNFENTPDLYYDKEGNRKIYAGEEINNNLNGYLSSSPNDILTLKRQFSLLRRDYDLIRQDLSKKDEKIKSLADQIVTITLNSNEKQNTLNDKIANVTKQNEELKEIQSRFELVQRIINEKDLKINELNDKFEALNKKSTLLKTDLEESIDIKNNYLNLINGFITQFLANNNLSISKNDTNEINGIKEKLNTILSLIDDKTTALESLNSEYALLKKSFLSQEQELAKKTITLENIQKRFNLATKKMEILSLELTQTVKSKDAQIEKLDKMLSKTDKSAEKDNKLKTIYNELLALKAKIKTNTKYLKEKEMQLSELNKNFSKLTDNLAIKDQLIVKKNKIIDDYNKNFNLLSKDNKDLFESLTNKNKQLNNLEVELVELKKDIRIDNDKIDFKLKKLNSVTKELQEKTKLLDKSNLVINNLKTNYNSLNNDNNLKTKTIETLTEKIAKISINKNLNSLDNLQITNSNRILDLYRMSLNSALDTIKSKDSEINETNIKLTELGNKIGILKSALIKVAKTKQIKSSVSQVPDSQTKEILDIKDEQLNEISGILQIYKLKLGDANTTLKEKSANIVTLEEQLNYVQEKLFQKDKVLSKTRKELSSLEKELLDLQERLNCINEKNTDQSDKTKTINETHLRIIEINEYLIKKLIELETIESISLKNDLISLK